MPATIIGGDIIIRGQGRPAVVKATDYGDIVTVWTALNETRNVHPRLLDLVDRRLSSGAAVRLLQDDPVVAGQHRAGRPEDFVADGHELFNGVHFDGIAEHVYHRDCLGLRVAPTTA